MTTCVVYKPTACFPPKGVASEVFFDSLCLKAGAKNYLTDDELERLISHDDYPRYEAWGAIEVIQPEQEAPELAPAPGQPIYPANLSGISVEKAEDIVNGCDDVVVLRAWFDAETRKTLREILTRRIEEILE